MKRLLQFMVGFLSIQPLTPLLSNQFDRDTGECPDKAEPFQPCEDFELAYGIASTKTVLWVLAETSHKFQFRTRNCVELLTTKERDHTIGIEFQNSNQKLQCSLYVIPDRKDRTCIGWDNSTAAQKMLSLAGADNIKNKIQEVHEINMYLSQFKELYKLLKDKSLNWFKQTMEIAKLQSPKDLALHKAIDWILYQERQGKSFSKGTVFAEKSLESALSQEEYKELLNRENEKNPEKLAQQDALKTVRDQAFRNTIRSFQEEYPKKRNLGIFMAGAGHVFPIPADDQRGIEMAKNLTEILEEHSHEVPFAVLTYKG